MQRDAELNDLIIVLFTLSILYYAFPRRIFLPVLNNLIYKSGFQNIAIRRELRGQWRSVYRKEIN